MTDTDQKLKRLDDDVRDMLSILHSIGGTQQRHSKRFDELYEVLDQHTPALDAHGSKMDLLRFRADSHKGRIEHLEALLRRQFSELGQQVEHVRSELEAVARLLRADPAANVPES